MLPPKMMIASRALLLVWLMAASAAQAQTVWYVDDDGDADNACTSWPDACPELQTALSLAGDGDQIWVAEGTYKPDYDIVSGEHTGNREASFQLISGVGIYGGFDGTEEFLEDRAELFDATIVTGDLLGDDGPDFKNNDENSYHVATSIGTAQSAILDGFRITAGNANGSGDLVRGAGLFNDEGSPTIANCIFSNNRATWGGGLHTRNGAPTLSSCDFTSNVAVSGDGLLPAGAGLAIEGGDLTIRAGTFAENSASFGAALLNLQTLNTPNTVLLTNCNFVANNATWGGAIETERSELFVLEDCLFVSNSAADSGGGLRNFGGEVVLENCSFTSNSAGADGGAIEHTGNVLGSSMTFTDCDFIDNAADRGGAVDSLRRDTFIDCRFTNNHSTREGGAYNKFGHLESILVNCQFNGNSTPSAGGAIWASNGARPALVNCSFSGNTAKWGGALAFTGTNNAMMVNCTFSGNEAQHLGGGAWICGRSNPMVINSIFWGNIDGQGTGEQSQLRIDNESDGSEGLICTGTHTSAVVHHSTLQGWSGELGGTGNQGEDPLFIDADGEDDLYGTDDDNLHLSPGSPALDSGVNVALPNDTLDIDGDGNTIEPLALDASGSPRFLASLGGLTGGMGELPTVDRGAFEGSSDCNGNGSTDQKDIASGTSADCNGNGVPDECEISVDCNDNGVCDLDDILNQTSQDCNENNIPDECEVDCNANGTQDECDISSGDSDDCNQDGVPDECLSPRVDCNANGLVDACETEDGATPDDNGNGLPDECEPSILYVNHPAAGDDNGTSWEHAFTRLQDALAVASASQGLVQQIWVAQGVYLPALSPGDRAGHFLLADDVAMYGGFEGTETQLEQRDPLIQATVLSGDLNGDDTGEFSDISRLDNSYNVVRCIDAGPDTVLDGFVVTSGHATPFAPLDRNRGAGLWMTGTPTLGNMTFTKNWAVGEGAGIYHFGRAVLHKCTFDDNETELSGGGIFLDGSTQPPVDTSPVLVDCTFLKNTAFIGGGLAMQYQSTKPLLINCKFLGNSASPGGGLYNENLSHPTLINCLFSGNTGSAGGAQYDLNASSTLINCTYTNNAVPGTAWPGGIFSWSGAAHTTSIVNCIFWENSNDAGMSEDAQLRIVGGGTIEADHTCIQGLTGDLGGVGNIGDDPLLVDADGPDGEVGTEDDDLRLASGSPCIDAADNASVPEDVETDLDGNPRIIDGDDDGESVVDMGAYEYLPCLADFDGDGVVGPVDLATLLGSWGPCEGCPADLDGNGQVGPFDLVLLLATWGECD